LETEDPQNMLLPKAGELRFSLPLRFFPVRAAQNRRVSGKICKIIQKQEANVTQMREN